MMLFQNSPCPALIGLVNAANSAGIANALWDVGANLADAEFDSVYIFNSAILGYDTTKSFKGKKIVFVDCDIPPFLQGNKKIAIYEIKTKDTIDDILYPPDSLKNELFDYSIFVYSDKKISESQINNIFEKFPGKSAFIAGPIEIDSPNYLGNIAGKDVIAAAKMAEIVITDNVSIGNILANFVDCQNTNFEKYTAVENPATYRSIIAKTS